MFRSLAQLEWRLRCPVPMMWGISQWLGIYTCRISSCRPRPTCSPQHRTVGFFFRGFPRRVARRRRNVGRLGTTGAISRFGPLGQPMFCARMGARARAFETNQNRAISFAGPREDFGTLMGHNGVTQPSIRRYGRRVSHLPLFLEKRHDLPHRCLPGCWRFSCILAQAGPESPIALSWNLNATFLRRPNSKRSPRQSALRMEIRALRPKGVLFSGDSACRMQGLCQRIQIIARAQTAVYREVPHVARAKDGAPQELLRFPSGQHDRLIRPHQKREFPRIGDVCSSDCDAKIRARFLGATFFQQTRGRPPAFVRPRSLLPLT